MSECSWWWTALVFIGGVGIGQMLLMVALMMLAGGNTERDEHERSGV